MKLFRCEECGILLKWVEVQRVTDEHNIEHRVCIDCAEDKYFPRGSEDLPA